MTVPVLRSQSFLLPLSVGGESWASSFEVLDGNLIAGWRQQEGGSRQAVLQQQPQWPVDAEPSLPLANPYFFFQEERFPNLAELLGLTPGQLEFEATALSIEPNRRDAVLALQVSDGQYNDSLLLALADLDQLSQAPAAEQALVPSQAAVAGVQLLVFDEVTDLLPLPGSDSAWLSLSTEDSRSDLSNNPGGAHHAAYRHEWIAGLDNQVQQSPWPVARQDTVVSRSAGFDDVPDIFSISGEAVVFPDPEGDQASFATVSLATLSPDSDQAIGGAHDVLLSFFDASGDPLDPGLQLLVGNDSAELNPQIAVDQFQDVLVASSLRGPFPAEQLSDQYFGVSLSKFQGNGDLVWHQHLVDSVPLDSLVRLSDLQVAPDGTILLLGRVRNSITGLHGMQQLGDGSDFDAFLTAFASTGERLWTHQFGSPLDDFPRAMSLIPGQSVDDPTTVVVVGDQRQLSELQPGQSESDWEQQADSTAQGWVELIEIAPTDQVDARHFAPESPQLVFSAGLNDSNVKRVVVEWSDFEETYFIRDLAGSTAPDAFVYVNSAFSPGQWIQADSTGRWQLNWPFSTRDTFSSPEQIDRSSLSIEAFSWDPPTSSGDGQQASFSDLTKETVELVFSGPLQAGAFPQQLPVVPIGQTIDDAELLQRSFAVVGGGEPTFSEQRLLVDYSGRLMNGVEFDSSFNPGRDPLDLKLDDARYRNGELIGYSVIQGWNDGLKDIPIGSQLELQIPAALAYGAVSTWIIVDNNGKAVPDQQPFRNTTEAFALQNAQNLDPSYEVINPTWLLFDADGSFVPTPEPITLQTEAAVRELIGTTFGTDVQLRPIIPSDADLTFYIDIRADLSTAQDFLFNLPNSDPIYLDAAEQLRSVLERGYKDQDPWWDLRSEEYRQERLSSLDIIDLALLDLDDGTSASDLIQLSSNDSNDALLQLSAGDSPQIALGGSGNDRISSWRQTSLLYGESGDDELSSVGSTVAVFEGGDGRDIFIAGARYNLVIGNVADGDQLVLPDASNGSSRWIQLVDADEQPITSNFFGLPFERLQRLGGDDVVLQDVFYRHIAPQNLLSIAQLPIYQQELSASDLLQAHAALDAPFELKVDLPDLTGTIADAQALLSLANDGSLLNLDRSIYRLDQDEIDSADLLALKQNDEFDQIDASSVLSLSGSVEDAEALVALADDGSLLNLHRSIYRLDQDEIDAADLLALKQNDEFERIDATSLLSLSGSVEDAESLVALADDGSLLNLDRSIYRLDQDEIDAADLLTLIQNDEFDTIDATSAIKFTGSGDQRRLVFSDSSFLTSPSPRLEFLDLPSTLKLGDQLEVVLHFDQSIGDVDQNSSLTFPDGVVAAYQADRSDPQAGELHFRYQVQEGDILNGSFSDDSVTFSQENVTDNYLPANTNLSDDIDLTIDGVSPVLMRIAAPSQIFSRNQTISFSLEFSEPVTAQNDSVPSLRMTNGMQANLTTDSSSASSTQQFDLLIADNITDTQELRIDALLGQFVDRAGNLFEASTLPSLEEPPRIAPWMLDVDGDNRLSLYTDGIMIIRTLIGLPDPTSGFGSSFFGAFHGRHSAEVTRQNLTSMFEAGFFDFDQNGTQSLYTDGIQLIRYLVNPSLLNPISSDAILGQNSPFISASDLIPHFNQLNPELI